jgi:hypothetical protein
MGARKAHSLELQGQLLRPLVVFAAVKIVLAQILQPALE